jgi:protein-S-isoprenylcysteine O-methyltransferase Ste14
MPAPVDDSDREKDAAKDGAAVKVPPPLIPLSVILLGASLQYLLPIDLGFDVGPALRYWIGGIILAGAILALGLWAIVLFRRSGESEIPWKPTRRLVLRGPYRFTRNPMYLQMVLACIGVGLLLMNAWIILLTPLATWLLYRLAIVPEEEYLERKFGEEYLDYKRRVRRWV